MGIHEGKYTPQPQTSPYSFTLTFILKVTSWLQCPSPTYGLCMPPAFHMTAEMTSGEFSVGAGRWGCRLAFLWSASEAQVTRKTLPYPTAGEQQDVTIEVQNPSSSLFHGSQ